MIDWLSSWSARLIDWLGSLLVGQFGWFLLGTIFGLYIITVGWYYRHIKTVRLNPVSVIAGLLCIISPFLPWLTIDASFSTTLFGPPISFKSIGALNLPALVELASTISSFIQQYTPEYVAFVHTMQLGCILVLILLVLAGAIAFFKGIIGGIVSLFGMILFTAAGGNFYQSITLNIGHLSTSLTIGYFIAWIGCFAGFASYFYRPKGKVPESQ